MKTNEELAIEITSLFDDGFSTKTEFAQSVLDIYTHLEMNDFQYAINIINAEIDARDNEDCEELKDIQNELSTKLKIYTDGRM